MPNVDRRAFLTGSIAVGAALAAWPARAARTPDGRAQRSSAIERVAVVDRGVAGSAAFAASARARGLPLFEFTSDVARVWMHELEPRLRATPLEILGYTSPATSFCLELLARDYGAGAAQPLDAATWLIATTPMRRAPLAPIRKQRG